MDVLGDRVLELGPKPDAGGPYKNFKLTRDSDGIAWLLFDREGASANTLSADLIEELDKVLGELESARPAGLVIRSAKKSGFIAGADVNAFRGASDVLSVETEIGRAHPVIDRLEALRIPTVAVIHGFCLGGGLEVALACQMRIAIDDARFGFPEVMLGLHPGLGGTVRFTQLVNPMQSMPLMLTGKTIDARKAKSLGLVDAVTQERHVRSAVKDAVFGRLKRAAPGLLNSILNWEPVRKLLASRMRSEAAKAAPQEHYPAPYALIDLWERYGGDKYGMLRAEQASFARLMVTPTAQNLIRVFFLREQMKKLAGSGNKINHVHVIGAGAMGGDIAAWCAGQDMRVTLADMKAEPIAGAIKRAVGIVRQDPAQAHRCPGCAGQVDARYGRRGRPQRRPHHRGGAGKAGAEAEGLCRARAHHEARRDSRHQHVEHSAAGSAHHVCKSPSGCSACISSTRCRGCSSSRSSATTARMRNC